MRSKRAIRTAGPARARRRAPARTPAPSARHERVVPGTASAREGYPAEGGTADGESLAGVESSGEDPGARRSGEGEVTDTPARRKRHR
ncbi:hypothetical protein [Streptomyces chryseus]|uniref:Uncharacterized protein n=1 Tax=Streptomyces chryseus TaxID=68186 RepID=A0ABQ3DKW9_9ACTN|nr:hypothetical protein [Streptomyces chryseus]GHA97168.1 hypothetical protein GCM10010346_19920 [Streptomyces chryseus]